jgi:peptide-methionine (R)-S-oxide reductase
VALQFSQNLEGTSWTRRAFLASGVGVASLLIWRALRAGDDPADDARLSVDDSNNAGPVLVARFSDAGERRGAAKVAKVAKTNGEWKKLLSRREFAVARKGGTEAAFSGNHDVVHERGVFLCVCCGNALFSPEAMFDSVTGWPSFWAPIARENVWTRTDSSFGMIRIEVLCWECDAHLGHVFEDGPQPTGLRYCMNSVAMRFARASA